MTKSERLRSALWFRHSGFVIVSTFVIRASSFRERRLVSELSRRDRAPIFFAANWRLFLLRGRDGLVDFGRELGPHLLQTFPIEEFVFENELLSALQRILGERLALDIFGHVARVVMLTMAGETQSRRDDELRWTASTRALNRGADNFEALREVGAV